MGFLEKTVDSVSSSEARLTCFPQVSGIDGGRDLNVHTLAKDGATLLGRIRGAERNSVLVTPDLEQNLATADAFATGVKQAIDSYAVQSRIDNIQDERWPEPSRRFDSPPLPGGELDLRSTGITSIIWACGYRPDFRWIKLPIFDGSGFRFTAVAQARRRDSTSLACHGSTSGNQPRCSARPRTPLRC
jgi:putative flavoprotein involved in K+ transport